MRQRFIIICAVLIFIFELFTIRGFYNPRGGFKTGKLNYACMSSVTSSECTNIVKPSANEWNGITGKVVLTYSQTLVPYYNVPVAPIWVYYSDSTQNPTVYGGMVPRKSCPTPISCVAGGFSETWVRVDITVYRKNIEKKNTALNAKKKTTVHEFGHALSLQDYISAPDFTFSVMSQGISTNYTVKAYDKTDIKNRWGK